MFGQFCACGRGVDVPPSLEGRGAAHVGATGRLSTGLASRSSSCISASTFTRGEAETEAALAAGERRLQPGEGLEDAGEHVGADADAGVSDAHHRLAAALVEGERDRVPGAT